MTQTRRLRCPSSNRCWACCLKSAGQCAISQQPQLYFFIAAQGFTSSRLLQQVTADAFLSTFVDAARCFERCKTLLRCLSPQKKNILSQEYTCWARLLHSVTVRNNVRGVTVDAERGKIFVCMATQPSTRCGGRCVPSNTMLCFGGKPIQ